MKNKKWNKCDKCGKFIAYINFENGATRKLKTPDSHFSNESYDTTCKRCK